MQCRNTIYNKKLSIINNTEKNRRNKSWYTMDKTVIWLHEHAEFLRARMNMKKKDGKLFSPRRIQPIWLNTEGAQHSKNASKNSSHGFRWQLMNLSKPMHFLGRNTLPTLREIQKVDHSWSIWNYVYINERVELQERFKSTGKSFLAVRKQNPMAFITINLCVAWKWIHING